MRLVDILAEDRIIPSLASTTRDGALAEMVGCMADSVALDRDRALNQILQRERAGSTGIGQGIAIPHAKLAGLPRIVACFGRSTPGVEFGSLDGKPAHLLLTLLAPQGNAGLHLQALARASRLLQDGAFRAQLMQLEDREAIWQAFVGREASLEA
ncbi:MAG TPA: PTS sugar transporter subunit IIA [Myxococcales bacterium LLY-WYZ-16_1]|jgi:PTS system nitrogen regulatory IIA component|nr:PTS sugar transporter subunit IIA [Myxococcales bacterium LLY-WYZ-16_1]